MPFRTRLAALAVGVGFIVAAIGLLIGGWFLGLRLAPELNRTSAMLVNLVFALTPAAIVLAAKDRKTPLIPVAVLAILCVVTTATFNIHAAVWIGPHQRSGSAERMLTVLSSVIWPVMAAGALGAAVSRRTGKRLADTASLVGPMALVAANAGLVWFLIRLLAGTVPMWLMVLIIVSISILLQFVLESEIALLMFRRASIAVPPSAAMAKSQVEAITKTSVDGPLVVDRLEEMNAEVIWPLFRRPVLILSAAMVRLNSAALMAVIAHEYAHVSLGHLRLRIWLSIASSFLLVVATAMLAQAYGMGAPPHPVAAFLVVSVALGCQRLMLYAYVRRQEREADTFAASVAGADAVRAALRMTSLSPVIPSSFSIWMTHDSLDARLRALGDRVP